MLNKLKRRFDKRRLVLILALVGVALYVGWRTGGFDGTPDKPPCVAGRNEVKDDTGKVVQVTRTTCGEE